MDAQIQEQPEAGNSSPQYAWRSQIQVAVCEHCDWNFATLSVDLPEKCPHCFRTALTPMDENLGELLLMHPPEFVSSFELPETMLAKAIKNFASGIPFAPPDLSPSTIQNRLRQMYLPVWLVDSKIRAYWQAEVGFNYEVISHQDHYDRGRWISKQIKEKRVRWEPRLGKLNRQYSNVSAPALEEHQALIDRLGLNSLNNAKPYDPDALFGASVRLPNRSPEDTWSDASPAFQAAAAEECRQAAKADLIRQFTWQPEFLDRNWTLLLSPLYSSYYVDEDNLPIPIYIHGQSGHILGLRRASMKRAKRTAIILLIISAAVFLLSLLISALSVTVPGLLAMGVLGMAAALLVGLGAILPLATVWWFNRSAPLSWH